MAYEQAFKDLASGAAAGRYPGATIIYPRFAEFTTIAAGVDA